VQSRSFSELEATLANVIQSIDTTYRRVKGKSFVKIVHKGIKLMRRRCMEEKTKIPKDKMIIDN